MPGAVTTTQSSSMNPYLLVRYFMENNIQEKYTLIITASFIDHGLSPFVHMADQKTLFEIACDHKLTGFLFMFVLYWEKHPSWNLHDEIYKLKDKDTLHYINTYVLQTNVNNPVKNHLLNIIHLALI